jgi:2-polyprenyl-3-methyl-5-hydroxy-6-metoxy-1,4-benzoquinol methylase
MVQIESHHAAEVRRGQRFQFGKNWQRFLAFVNEERIELAEQSLKRFLGHCRLNGMSFLDVGSGSGLFSLAARRLGARVLSFDYDPQSVACTAELRDRYFPRDNHWIIEHGSVLDRDFLAQLGEHDIVYSWGVLHHTGEMWSALENVKPLVRLGGQLFIAIYNDLGAVSDKWLTIKRRYNALPTLVRGAYALTIVAASEARTLLGHLRNDDVAGYVRSWTDYQRLSTRGMSRWHDWLDWIGGYPYERASIEAIVDCFGKDGFRLTALEDRSSGYGCNEFVFCREAELGTAVDVPLAESKLLLRRFGRRLAPPFARTALGYVSKLPNLEEPIGHLLMFRNGQFVGVANPNSPADTVTVAPAEWTDSHAAGATYHLLQGYIRELAVPIQKQRGHMWSVSVPDLSHLADNAPARRGKSPIFVFENAQQLASPHSMHDDISKYGAGRFSHWGDAVYFSTSDNTNPNENGRVYRLIYPAQAS